MSHGTEQSNSRPQTGRSRRSGERDADSKAVPSRSETADPRPEPTVDIITGDALRELQAIPNDSVDAVITDPPSAINTVGDFAASLREGPARRDQRTCMRCPDVCLDGYTVCVACLAEAEVEAFAGAGMLGQQSQNWNEQATHSRGFADNDPHQFGRWCLLWLTECYRVLKPGGYLLAFGGTRTWHRLAVAVEDAGFEVRDSLAWLYGTGFPKSVNVADAVERHREHHLHSAPGDTRADQSASGGQQARRPTDFDGLGTALKPAHEPIVFARKTLMGTVALNVLSHGTGALDIDATRVEDGRWPTNVLLDQSQADELDAASGRASRFFWVAKPDQNERVRIDGLAHPTVKPLALIRELVRLVAPGGGTVLDPFAGSGTTAEACLLEGRNSIVIERDPNYVPLIKQRLLRRTDPLRALAVKGEDLGLFEALLEVVARHSTTVGVGSPEPA